MKLQIYDVDELTVQKLKARAKRLGYSGYLEMLREVIERLADEDVVLESDQRYLDVVMQIASTLEFVDQTLVRSIASGKLTSPFDRQLEKAHAVRRKEDNQDG